MKNKHLFSLLDQTFTTVHVTFGSQYSNRYSEIPPGDYQATIEDVQFEPRQDGSVKMRTNARVRAPWVHDDYTEQRSSERDYIYKVPKAWNVKENDHLVVLSPLGGLTVVHVHAVDDQPDIDIDAERSYKWAVCKINTTEFDDLRRREKEFDSSMLQIERVKQRDGLLEAYRQSLPEGSEARRLFEATAGSLSAPTVDASATQPEWMPPQPAPSSAESNG